MARREPAPHAARPLRGLLTDDRSATADWIPTLIDYLYVSTTNSSAFSPTDTMPLSTRAELLIATEATAALMTSLLVVA